MAIDRAAVLRSAEKLLRLGKLDAAIAEYLRVVEEHPHDWNTANVLGDLYLRVGQSDRAVAQFVRIADSLSHEGFWPKAAALYKKILKVRPDDEHALLQAGELAAKQGVLVDTRTYLSVVVAQRVARGDEPGAGEVRGRLFDVYLAAGDLERAREYAVTDERRTALGQAFAARGNLTSAAEFLAAEKTEGDAGLQMPEEADPDVMIAERLGQTFLEEGLAPPQDEPETGSRLRANADPHNEPGARHIATEPAPPVLWATDDVIEIDLSDELAGFTMVPDPAPPLVGDLEEVFEQFREKASRATTRDAAREYDRGMTLRDSGRLEESLQAFELASRDPLLRFHAARAAAQVHQQRHERHRAVEWLERAAQSPPPATDEADEVFYELAETLEAIGESDRALAIYVELQAGAGDYRDVSERIRRLTSVRARG